MNLKELKPYFVVSFIGFLIGIFISPLLYKSVSKAILSPVSPTLVQTSNFLSPLVESQVLGDSQEFSTSVSEEPVEDVKELDSVIGATETALLQPSVLAENNSGQNLEIENSQENIVDTENNIEFKDGSQPFSDYSESLTIALVGDSMVDVMGRDLPYLKTALQSFFPRADFNLLNYGVGAENIERGYSRIQGEYDYKEVHYYPLSAVNPDIVIIESFAYNPFSQKDGELDKQWTYLSMITDFLKNNTSAQIIIMATIAPSRSHFGQGPGGVNWPADIAWEHSQRINSLLDNAIKFAQAANLPYIDVYHQTLQVNGEGNSAYISSHDHIHQSEAGNRFLASLIAEKIFNLKIF
jgi:hypothetical protein